MRRTPDCEAAAERLTTEAYRLGSMDNISAVVVRLNSRGPWTASQRAAVAMKNLSQRGFSQRGNRGRQHEHDAGGGAADPHGVTLVIGGGGGAPPRSSGSAPPRSNGGGASSSRLGEAGSGAANSGGVSRGAHSGGFDGGHSGDRYAHGGPQHGLPRPSPIKEESYMGSMSARR